MSLRGQVGVHTFKTTARDAGVAGLMAYAQGSAYKAAVATIALLAALGVALALPAQGAFVAVNQNTWPSTPFVQSATGAAWSSPTSPVQSYLQAVAYGGGLYVAVGGPGAVLTSPDAVTWTPRASGASGNFLNIAYG